MNFRAVLLRLVLLNLLFGALVSCQQEPKTSVVNGVEVVATQTPDRAPPSLPAPTDTVRPIDAAATVSRPTATATTFQTSTPKSTATAIPATPTQELIDTTGTTDTELMPDCSDLPADYLTYSNGEQGVAFCYPSDWVVDDVFDISGLIAVSKTGFAMEKAAPNTLVLIYPHETVANFVDNPISSEDALGVAVVFFSMLVEDVASDEEEPTTIAINGQEQSSITAQGIADGDPVTGLLMGYKNDRALGMAITYLLQEDGDLAAAETIMDSVQVNLPRTSIASEAVPISVDEFYESTQGGGEPTVYQLHLEPEMPVLLVVHTYKSKEPGQNVASVNVYDPQGAFMGQFDAGWTSSNGARPVSDNWVAFYNFGFQKPEAISFTSAEAGDHTIEVAGAFDSTGVPHRLGAFDMRPNAAMVVDIVAQELDVGEVFDYTLEGLADQPVLTYVRPTGAAADSVTLSLALLDEMGDEIEERHNYSTGGDPVFLYWVPRDDGQYTVRLTEVNDQASPYELTVLKNETIGRAQVMQTAAAYAKQYNVDLVVQENGDLAISEKITLDIFDDEITNLQRSLPLTDDTEITEVTVSENGRPYKESTSGEVGTFQIIEEDGHPTIQWFFANDSADPREFLLDFVVKNAIRNDDIETYNWETRAGSILNWQAIPPNRDFAVAHGDVRVRMPQDVELHHVIAYGATGEATAPIDGPNFQPAVSDELSFTLFRDLEPETAMEIEVVFTQPE